MPPVDQREAASRALARSAERLRSRWLLLSVAALLVVVSFAQRVGQTTFDTKFDLTADPIAALGRSFTLWSTQTNLGGLQNQSYGYIFPQGLWFAIAHVVALPDWVAQRIWSAIVLLVAYEGARRLARALGIGAETIPVVAGLAYALTPRIVGLSGALTGEILPSAVLPWVCLPVVLALGGHLSARRAAVLSGLAVLCMGGVNAAENLAAFPLPMLLVASGLGSKAGRRFAGWWAGAMVLACLWWMLPLLLLGRYSPPFLDYIETAYATTRATGWSNAVRGAEHWVSYIYVGGEPWWPAANAMSTNPTLIIVAGVVAAIGLLGVFHPRMPRLLPFGMSVLLGLLCVTVGHGGVAGTPLASVARDLLDGPLVAFRNVHKVDPLIRLPLALGLANVCAVLLLHLARPSWWRDAAQSWRLTVPRLRVVGVAALVVLLLASAAPIFAGKLRQPGWDRVPEAWQQAARWVDHDGPGATLVLPATGFGQQVWGWTVDEPIQGLARSAWVARSQIPLVPPTSIRFLDGIEQRLEDGTGSPVLAETLAAAGVTRVLVRNDVDLRAADVADPARVAAALLNSPGLRPAKAFGRSGQGKQSLIEIYRVDGATGEPRVTDQRSMPLLTGAPEDVLTAKEAGLVAPDAHVRVGVAGRGEAPDVVTDGYRRIVRQFGRFHDAASQVMTRDERYRGGRKVSDFAGVSGVPRVYAEYSSLRAVTASSSAGYADSVGQIRAELGPASAVDGDDSTFWRSSSFQQARGQWVQLDLDKPRRVGLVTVLLAVDGFTAAPATRVQVSAGKDSRQLAVDQRTGRVVVNFGKQVPASRIRVTVLAAGGNDPGAAVAIREIDVAGLDVQRSLVVPDVGAGARTSFAFSSEAPRRACLATTLGPACDAYAARPGAEQGHMNRVFTTHEPGSWALRGQVVALPTEATARTLLPLGRGVRATANSVLANDPSVSGVFAMDGRSDTAWLANLGDLSPALTLTWDKPRRLSRLRVDAAIISSVAPYEAVIEARGQKRVVPLGPDTLGTFKPLVARAATITFHGRSDATGEQLPLGVGEVRLAGLEGQVRGVARSWRLTSQCGLGPLVSINGIEHKTRVTGTLGAVVDAQPLDWSTCGGPVALGSGRQLLSVAATDVFTPTTAVLQSQPVAAGPGITGRRVTGGSTASSSIRMRVGAGPVAVLSFGQNSNPGWQATLAGASLTPTVVDGWQQGFVLPAGAGGKVEVQFGPGTAYHVALAVGALGALVLLLLLLLDLRWPSRLDPMPISEPRTRRRSRLLLVLALVVLGLLGGPVLAGAVIVGGVVASRAQGLTAVLGTGSLCVLASGIAAVYSPDIGSGSPDGLANGLAAVGAGLLVATLLTSSARESPHVAE